MPLGVIKVSIKLNDEQKKNVLKETSKIISKVTGKPESYIMAIVEDNINFIMSGDSSKPAAFIQIKGIGGINPNTNQRMSQEICKLLNEKFGITGERIYLNFENVEASDWGWDSKTFG